MTALDKRRDMTEIPLPYTLDPENLEPKFAFWHKCKEFVIQASERGNVEVVRYLLEARAGVDMVDARTHYWVAVKEVKLSYHNGYI